MEPKVAEGIYRVTIGALLLLVAYSSAQGIVVPLVVLGVWDALGLPPQISNFMQRVPTPHLLVGYALIIVHWLSLIALLHRQALTLSLFFTAVLLRLFIWAMTAAIPGSITAIGYVTFLVEGTVAIGLTGLFVTRNLRGEFLHWRR